GQELEGGMIVDAQKGVFKDDWVIQDEVPEDLIEQVTVGVDPSGGNDEVGIVASALLNDGRFAVLADRSTTGTPAQWGEAVGKCHDESPNCPGRSCLRRYRIAFQTSSCAVKNLQTVRGSVLPARWKPRRDRR